MAPPGRSALKEPGVSTRTRHERCSGGGGGTERTVGTHSKKKEKRTGRTRQRLTKPVHQFRKFRIPKESGRRGPRTRPQQTTSRLIKKRAPMSQFRRGFVLTRTTAATKKKVAPLFPPVLSRKVRASRSRSARHLRVGHCVSKLKRHVFVTASG